MAMASINTSSPVAVMTTAGFTSIFTNAFATVAAWNDTRVTRKSLSALSARELEDIGLTYGDIDLVATRISR